VELPRKTVASVAASQGSIFSRATWAKNRLSDFFFLGTFTPESYHFLFALFSTYSAAAAFRFGCGSFRGPPAPRTHRFPAATPQVGQATEDTCFRVSCFVFNSCLRCSVSAGLRFLDGHRAIFQKRDDQFAIYLQAAVVADQALPLELVHEFTYSWAGGSNHLR
jgi:hypothetical protein